MDKRAFSRVSDKKHTSGFYVNVIFEGEPSSIALLQNRFSANNEVFRVLVSAASTPKQAA
jgi:ribosomal protein S6